MIGHCLSAAGAIESVAAVLELKGGFVHASLNCEDLHPAIAARIDEERVPRTIRHVAPRVVAKSSFGFGDVNSCILFRSHS
jgi:3-oxoacyl-(acyl-carrier-protein) synthase